MELSRDPTHVSILRSGSDANRYPPKLEVQEKIQPMDERETCVANRNLTTGSVLFRRMMELRAYRALACSQFVRELRLICLLA